MKPLKLIILAALVLGLSACAQKDEVSRNEPLSTQLLGPAPVTSFNVQDVRISVPDTLSVSEANVYYPTADIVWRGDVYGERHQQIEALFEEAMTRGLKGLHGTRAIFVDVEVTRFHSLTERARYTVGGVHSIRFMITLRDVQTGAIIGKPHLVNGDLKAYGGKKAVANEHRGLTQKVRILAHLADLIQHEVISLKTDDAVTNLPALASE
ncbi:DUF6778 family protein [Profundibacter sp.]